MFLSLYYLAYTDYSTQSWEFVSHKFEFQLFQVWLSIYTSLDGTQYNADSLHVVSGGRFYILLNLLYNHFIEHKTKHPHQKPHSLQYLKAIQCYFNLKLHVHVLCSFLLSPYIHVRPLLWIKEILEQISRL